MGKVESSGRVVTLKIVYVGAAGVGKTTNLERVKSRTSDERPGELVAQDDEGDRTLMLEWMPVKAGKGFGYDLRLQIFAIPGVAKNESTKKKLLRDADGIVFVLDSDPAKLGANRTAWGELSDHLSALGLARERVPLVIQLNKRDLPNAMNGDDLRARLGMGGYPVVEAVAKGTAGVGPTLLDVTRRALRTLSDPECSDGEPLSVVEISRLESSVLPDAFTACGLLPRRVVRTTPGPIAAEEIAVFKVDRRHDSPTVPKELPPKESTPSQRLQAALRTATPHSPMQPRTASQEAMLQKGSTPVPQRSPVQSSHAPAREHVTAPERPAVLQNPQSADRIPDPDRPTSRPPGSVSSGSLAAAMAPLRSPPPASPPAHASEERELAQAQDPARLRDMVVESEARVMAKLAQVEDQIAELRGLLLNVADQVRRVSTVPPVSEQRVVHLVRDALDQLELKPKAK
jgi:signal recognition particle receptor subunit beta